MTRQGIEYHKKVYEDSDGTKNSFVVYSGFSLK